MRKTTDEYVEPEPAFNPNPIKWIMIDKKHPEMKTPYDKESFKVECEKKIRDIVGEEYRYISAEPMATACSVMMGDKVGDHFAHVSYNILFVGYNIEVE